jgi:cell division protein FtsL
LKQTQEQGILAGLIRFVVDTLTGRLGVAMMVAGYSTCAFVLLGYVSTQVYTYSLMEDIHKREQVQRMKKESIGLLTERYAALSSRKRIIGICESRLDMVPADASHLERVAVDLRRTPDVLRADFKEEPVDLPGMMGSNINEITEVIQR